MFGALWYCYVSLYCTCIKHHALISYWRIYSSCINVVIYQKSSQLSINAYLMHRTLQLASRSVWWLVRLVESCLVIIVCQNIIVELISGAMNFFRESEWQQQNETIESCILDSYEQRLCHRYSILHLKKRQSNFLEKRGSFVTLDSVKHFTRYPLHCAVLVTANIDVNLKS